jgi:hypothetical protein
MTNLPQMNFPAFYAAAKNLREMGYDVVSPAELDDTHDAAIALSSPDGTPNHPTKTWGDFLARDVKIIADGGVQGIIFLPGWEASRGARLEASLGLLQPGFAFFQYTCRHVHVLSRRDVAWRIFDVAHRG